MKTTHTMPVARRSNAKSTDPLTGPDPRPEPEQDAVLRDGRARRDEERHAGLGRRHHLELLPERVAHGAEPRARGHRLSGPDVRLPPARLLGPRPDEAADELLWAVGRLDVARQHAEHAKDVPEPAHVRLDGLLLEEAAAAGFGVIAGMPAAAAASLVVPPIAAPSGSGQTTYGRP